MGARTNLDIWFPTTKHDHLYLIHYSKITHVQHGFVGFFLISNFNTFLYISIRHIPCARKILSLLKSQEDYEEGKDSCYRDHTKVEWSCSSLSTRNEEISEKECERAEISKYCRAYNQHCPSLRSSANSTWMWLSKIWRVLGRTWKAEVNCRNSSVWSEKEKGVIFKIISSS